MAGDPANAEEPAIIVLGEWKKERLEGLLLLAGLFSPANVKVKKVGDMTVLESTGGEKFHLAAPEDGVLIGSANKKDFEALVARVAAKARPKLSKEVRELLKKLDQTRTVSMVGVIEDVQGTLTCDIMVEKGIRARLATRAPSAEVAQLMLKGAQDGLENFKKMLADRKELAFLMPALKGAKLAVQDSTLTGSLELSPEAVAKMVQLLIDLKVGN